MRLALGVEYDGSGFHGWETQRDRPTVQAALEAALAAVADSPVGTVGTVCAGRTDAGVHALGQVIHLDPPVARPLRAWVMGTNRHLPGSVAVLWAREAGEDFHARFSAVARHYRYVIRSRAVRTALGRGRETWTHRSLEVERMRAAAAHLVGEHDFSAFRSSGCQARNPRRRVARLEVRRCGERVLLEVTANAFLHHMVRNLAGVLMAVGAGDRPPEWAREVLCSRDRTRGGVTAPPDGLYLAGVDYPARFDLPTSVPAAGAL